MCTNLTITGSTPPPPGGLPTVVSVDFATDDAANCTTYECLIGKIISPCTKNESDLGNSQVTAIVKANFPDINAHSLTISFTKDGVLYTSQAVTITGVPGTLNAFWVRINGMYYRDISQLSNLTATFVS